MFCVLIYNLLKHPKRFQLILSKSNTYLRTWLRCNKTFNFTIFMSYDRKMWNKFRSNINLLYLVTYKIAEVNFI